MYKYSCIYGNLMEPLERSLLYVHVYHHYILSYKHVNQAYVQLGDGWGGGLAPLKRFETTKVNYSVIS